MTTLVKMVYGSHLYGTHTPQSDTDFKGVYAPPIADLILGKLKKTLSKHTGNSETKNTSEDIDDESYAIQYFLELGFKGEAVFLDMIHAPDTAVLETSPFWVFLRSHRTRFYTRSLKSYLGYCKTQAVKYGIKGSLLNEAQRAYDYLMSQSDRVTLWSVWNDLPTGEHIRKFEHQEVNAQNPWVYEVCGKRSMANTKCHYAAQTYKYMLYNFGERARLAAENQGIDWKAISHAFRAGYQLREIYQTGDLVFPLVSAEFLKKIKSGGFHYKNDCIGERLEDLIDEINILAECSNYPDKVDQTFFNEALIDYYKKEGDYA